ncbi:hypothetical protein CLV98_1207 [Dyadobacter jejuensis]|uniref:Uncharacterized protein n=1 Tax=Dyadobacter jejuensis TaxID=1082580 RepID=A0A316A7Q4_9BACT|nr:hypothetical protein CLV98_1207 [Dyadobacter jejuensis]
MLLRIKFDFYLFSVIILIKKHINQRMGSLKGSSRWIFPKITEPIFKVNFPIT